MFDTHSHLGRNAAVIVAWVLLSCGTIAVFTWLVRRLEARRSRAPRPKSLGKTRESKVEEGGELKEGKEKDVR